MLGRICRSREVRGWLTLLLIVAVIGGAYAAVALAGKDADEPELACETDPAAPPCDYSMP